MYQYTDEDWDLWAVIRSSCNRPTSDTDKNFSTDDDFINPNDFFSQQNDNLFDFSESSCVYDGLYEVYHRFIMQNSQPCTELKPTNKEENHEEPEIIIPSDNQKRKKKLERIIEASEYDLVEDDPWDWKKTSQKCLKSSPHSKSYYKCNNSGTNCPAKKHVQKTLDDENKFKVTYIGEHDHPPPPTKHCRKRNSTFTSTKKEISFDCWVRPPEVESPPSFVPTSTPLSCADDLFVIYPELGEEENPSLLIGIDPN
ncbi:putative WRKY transcription factor 29 [Forsythia ovata]|uniref:WRKY transcription factor 29 n=1 Tax=Forsythia ovata TaxID=205694 RepID=A0ABD1W719_9LAMI